jgi:hypothetical protein
MFSFRQSPPFQRVEAFVDIADIISLQSVACFSARRLSHGTYPAPLDEIMFSTACNEGEQS